MGEEEFPCFSTVGYITVAVSYMYTPIVTVQHGVR